MSAPTHKATCSVCGESVKFAAVVGEVVHPPPLAHKRRCKFLRAVERGVGPEWVAANGYPIAYQRVDGTAAPCVVIVPPPRSN